MLRFKRQQTVLSPLSLLVMQHRKIAAEETGGADSIPMKFVDNNVGLVEDAGEQKK
jgi:hypothetical protein